MRALADCQSSRKQGLSVECRGQGQARSISYLNYAVAPMQVAGFRNKVFLRYMFWNLDIFPTTDSKEQFAVQGARPLILLQQLPYSPNHFFSAPDQVGNYLRE